MDRERFQEVMKRLTEVSELYYDKRMANELPRERSMSILIELETALRKAVLNHPEVANVCLDRAFELLAF